MPYVYGRHAYRHVKDIEVALDGQSQIDAPTVQVQIVGSWAVVARDGVGRSVHSSVPGSEVPLPAIWSQVTCLALDSLPCVRGSLPLRVCGVDGQAPDLSFVAGLTDSALAVKRQANRGGGRCDDVVMAAEEYLPFRARSAQTDAHNPVFDAGNGGVNISDFVAEIAVNPLSRDTGGAVDIVRQRLTGL